MFVVQLTSRGLKGIGWFSASFAMGALGSSLLLLQHHVFAGLLFADLALLSSFVLQHLAVLRLDSASGVPFWRGLLLLGVQAVVDVFYLGGFTTSRARIICSGLLIALQVTTTAWVLWRTPRRNVQAPAAFSVTLLCTSGTFNVLRSVLLFCHLLSPVWQSRFDFLAVCMYLNLMLGLSFGFFWMTTATLTADVEHLASTDPLTRLYNRRVFLRWCEKEMLRSQRSSTPFSLLMLDLDHFKRINDNFGHHRGDEVLCAAVESMQDSIRGIDILCRWGGEEFAVLLPNAPMEATRIVAERIRDNVRRLEVALEVGTESEPFSPCLTVSIGAATYRDLDDDLPAMLLRADRALYRAKAAGRDQVLVGA